MLAAHPALAAEAAPDVILEAAITIAADLESLDARTIIRITNRTGGPVDEVPLWLFPERLANPPEAMDDVVLPRVYPAGFDPGGVTVGSIRREGGPALKTTPIRPALVRVVLDQPLAAGSTLALEVESTVRIPERYGPFGRVDDQLTLDGGFLPRPPPQGMGGFRERSPPAPIGWKLTLRWEGEGSLDAFVNGERLTLSQSPVSISGPPAERVSLVAAPSFRHTRFGSQGASVRFAHRRARFVRLADDPYTDLGRTDPVGQGLATASAVLEFLAERGPRRLEDLVMVEVPLRRDIAIAAPGMVLVSDRAFELTPTERFLRVHRVALARAVAAVRLRGGPASREPVRRRARVRDLLAIHLSEAWEAAVYGGRADIREILGPGRFIAAVDDVIRAPQIPFQSAWFRVVEDTDYFRDRFTLFSHSHPNGRVWREKLVDRLGVQGVDRLVDTLLLGETTFVSALAEVAPDLDALAYLAQWDDGAPEVNYRLVAVREVDGGLEAEVAREGPGKIHEPVTVVAQGAETVTAHWSGEGRTARLSLPGARPTDTVILDPGFRLVESDLGRAVHPRFDNRMRHPWRLRLKGFGFDVSSATGRVNSTVAGSILRTDDFRHTILLRVYDRERATGATVHWLRAFGPKIHASRRRYGLGTGLGVSRLKPIGDSPEGMGITLSAALAESTTVSATDPRSGHSFLLAAGPVLAIHQDETSLGAFATVAFRGLLPVGRRQVLAGRFQAGSYWGDVLDTQQWPAGGIQGVRAIGSYAEPGRHRLFGSLEWRHRLFTNLSWSLLNLTWIEAVDGVIFGDLASVTDRTTDLLTEVGLYGGVGYGLRVHHRIAGFRPMVLSVDYGVPVLIDGATSWPPTSMGSVVIAIGQIF